MQGAVDSMHEAVRALEMTVARLRFERAKARVLEKHGELFERLAASEREDDRGKP